MRCARTVAKPRRFRLNRTRRGLSTAEIVSQSAGRDGSKIENGKRSNLFPFELPTRRAAGAELVFNSHHRGPEAIFQVDVLGVRTRGESLSGSIAFDRFVARLEVAKGAEATRDFALFLRNERALVISDLHLGFGGALAEQGVSTPRAPPRSRDAGRRSRGPVRCGGTTQSPVSLRRPSRPRGGPRIGRMRWSPIRIHHAYAHRARQLGRELPALADGN